MTEQCKPGWAFCCCIAIATFFIALLVSCFVISAVYQQWLMMSMSATVLIGAALYLILIIREIQLNLRRAMRTGRWN